jgi:hypothetical protein
VRLPESLRPYGAWLDVLAFLTVAAALATLATLVVSCSWMTIDRAARDVSAACAVASAVAPLLDAGAHD